MNARRGLFRPWLVSSVEAVRVFRKALVWTALPVGYAEVLLTAPQWARDSLMRAVIERTGGLLILLCIAGRTWCSLYIGGHKERQLIVSGPYSITRNPLYAFSILGTVGIFAVFGSITGFSCSGKSRFWSPCMAKRSGNIAAESPGCFRASRGGKTRNG